MNVLRNRKLVIFALVMILPAFLVMFQNCENVPTNIKLVAEVSLDRNTINLSWPPVTNAQKYLVERSAGTAIFVATNDGLLRSTNFGTSWSPIFPGSTTNTGAYKSVAYGDRGLYVLGTKGFFVTPDLGKTWTAVATTAGYSPGAARMVAAKGAKVLVAGSTGLAISLDNGTTWRTVNNSTPGFSSDVQTAAITDTHFFVGTTNGIAISSDSGATWRLVSGGSPGMTGSGYVTNIQAVGSFVFARTNSTSPTTDSNGGFVMSSDSGATWRILRIREEGATADLVVSGFSFDGNVLHVAGYQGYAISTDKGQTFQFLPGQQLGINSNSVIGNLGFNACIDINVGTLLPLKCTTDGGSTWVNTLQGSRGTPFGTNYGGDLAVNQIYFVNMGWKQIGVTTSPQYTDTALPFMYQAHDFTFNDYTKRCARDWNGTYRAYAISNVNGSDSIIDSSPMTTPVEYTPAIDRNRDGVSDSCPQWTISLYAGDSMYFGSAIGRSQDQGKTWTIAPVIVGDVSFAGSTQLAKYSEKVLVASDAGLAMLNESFEPATFTFSGNGVNSVAVTSQGRIWIGTSSAGLQFSDNGGLNWSRVNGGLFDSNNIREVAANGETVAVATSGGVSVSRDNGLNWTNYNKSTPGFGPANQASTVAIVNDRSRVYAGFNESTAQVGFAFLFGNTWYNQAPGVGGYANTNISNKYFSPSNELKMYYATMNGLSFTYGTTHLTTVGGQRGFPVSNKVFGVNANGLVVFAGTQGGLYQSTDGAFNWTSKLTASHPDAISVGRNRDIIVRDFITNEW